MVLDFLILVLYIKIHHQTRGHRDFVIITRSFIVLCFIFWFIIHLNLDFVAAGLRYVSILFSFLQTNV